MTSQICLRDSPTQLLSLAYRDQSLLAHPLVTAMVISPPANQQERDSVWELRQTADRHDVAFLVADDLELLDQVMADGVEIDWTRDSYANARERLGAGRSIGCRVGLSRHSAMEAAEAGADYICFCASPPAQGSSTAIVEMLQWWTPIFEVPCMALANDDAEEMTTLTATNVDFIALDAELAINGLHALMGVQCDGQDSVQ